MSDIAEHLGEDEFGDNEAKLIDEIAEDNVLMMEKNPECWRRAQHPKGHGLVEARFEVLDLRDSAPELAIGLFADPRSYSAVIRFSNAADMEDNDKDGDAHGMAIKLRDVVGEKLLPDPDDPNSFDIILLDNETFFEGDLEQFSAFNDLTAEIANAKRNEDTRVQGALNGIWLKFFRKLFGKDILKAALAVSDQQPTSPDRAIYWSTTPYLLGDKQAVKYMAKPDPEPSEQELTKGVEGPDDLSKGLRARLSAGDAIYRFFVQIQSNKIKHPVEDPTIAWKGAKTVQVARIVIPKLSDISDAAWAKVVSDAEPISFNPWNVLPPHRPLGAINRARKGVYQNVRQRRLDRA